MIYIINYETMLSHRLIDFITSYCNEKEEHDVVCVIKNKNDILCENINNYFYKYRKSIIFAKYSEPTTLYEKYIQNKLYGRVDSNIVNSTMFIGSCKMIMDFWKDFDIIDNDENDIISIQKYTINKIKKQTFSTIFDSQYCIDNGEIFQSMNMDHEEITINNLHKFVKYFIPEISYIVGIPTYIYISEDKLSSIIFSICLLFVFTHYELFVKYENYKLDSKIMYAISVSIITFSITKCARILV